MSKYVLKQWSQTRFTIDKWDDDLEEVQSTYLIIWPITDENKVCDCPSFKQPCKHIGMVRQWLELARRRKKTTYAFLYNDRTQKFEKNPLDNPIQNLVGEAEKRYGNGNGG